jgi:hypothetical protein
LARVTKGHPAETMKAIAHFGNWHENQRKRERRTKAAPETPTKGQVNSTWPTPPNGGAVQALLHLQEPYGSGWSFFREAELDARASISNYQYNSTPLGLPLQTGVREVHVGSGRLGDGLLRRPAGRGTQGQPSDRSGTGRHTAAWPPGSWTPVGGQPGSWPSPQRGEMGCPGPVAAWC